MKYRKKPVVIEALQWTKENEKELIKWLSKNSSYDIRIDKKNDKNITSIEIKTLEGTMKATYGDYIIKGVNGELYPCKLDIFEKTYELERREKCWKKNLKR